MKLFQLPRDGSLGKDFAASIVVFLVALPLCMGIAIASGMPPAAGLISGIIGGIVVGFLAGAPLQVSGPAAGLAVIVWEIVERQGVAALAVILLIAGALQMAAGLMRLGQWFRAISPAVIYGMLAGIGVLIFASQFHVMVDDSPRGSGITNLISIPVAVYKGIFPVDGSSHHIAAVVGLITIGSIILWTKFRPEKLKAVPAPLVAVVVATGIATVMRLPINYVDVPANLLDSVVRPTLATIPGLLTTEVMFSAVVIAFIASAETLLSTSAVDQMHTGPRANYDRELAAQGVGNFLCGVFGALPITGVIVRSSANVQAGGKTRTSAIMHGFWLLGFVVVFTAALRLIPTSSLAAILVYTGYKLVSVEKIRQLASFGRGEVVVYAATVVGIVAVDLLTGVLVGLGLALLKLLYTFSHLRIRKVVRSAEKRIDMYLEGAATFIRLPKLADELERIPNGVELHIHVEDLDYIDHACLDLLSNWEKQRESMGTTLVVEWDALQSRYRRDRTKREQKSAESPKNPAGAVA